MNAGTASGDWIVACLCAEWCGAHGSGAGRLETVDDDSIVALAARIAAHVQAL